MNDTAESSHDKGGRLAYGFWRYGPGEADVAARMIEAAREAGVVHFDTADVYGAGAAEALLGEIRKSAPALLEGAEIATKGGVEPGVPYNSSREHIIRAAEASLQRLGMETVDLYYIHRPDLLAHPAEVAGALDHLVASGKARRVGVSNYAPSQLSALASFLNAPVSAHQIEFSPLHLAPLFDGALDQAMERAIDVYAWSPLAGGRLFAQADQRAARVQKALLRYGERVGMSAAAASLAFLLSHPARPVPIIGTKNKERLKECAAALHASMERREWYAIVEASLGEKLP